MFALAKLSSDSESKEAEEEGGGKREAVPS